MNIVSNLTGIYTEGINYMLSGTSDDGIRFYGDSASFFSLEIYGSVINLLNYVQRILPMRNTVLAKIFEDMADLLEIKGDNPFKIRAYRKAALNIEALPEDVEEVAGAGNLGTIPGVGKDLAQKIQDFLEDGKIGEFETLKKEIPESLLDVLAVPGLGPKKVKYLYDTLGIVSIEELEEEAHAGNLGDHPGVGTKTVENIQKGIALVRAGRERTPLGAAAPLAFEIVEFLKTLPEVENGEVTGSLRRCRETVKDIDILVTSTKPGKVMDKIESLPYIAEITAMGETKAGFSTPMGLHIDLRVVEPGSFGSALQYFTGSQAHNIRLREMAARLGLKINEYGVFRKKDDRKLGGREEREIYETLGLPFVPPELREDRGEIEAAIRGELPDLVEPADIKGDLHTHTNLSDGLYSLEEVALSAKEMGYRYVAITEHSKSLRIAGGIDEDTLRKQIKEIYDLNRKMRNFIVLTGIEVDILKDGSLDFPDEVLAECDVVIASVHSSFRQPEDIMTARIIRAMENPHVDIIAHPTGRLIGERDSYEADMEEIIRAAGRTNTALEINAHPKRLDLNDRHSRRAKELGVKLVVNTDMASWDGFRFMSLGVSVARRAWCSEGDVLNTLDTEQLLQALGA